MFGHKEEMKEGPEVEKVFVFPVSILTSDIMISHQSFQLMNLVL